MKFFSLILILMISIYEAQAKPKYYPLYYSRSAYANLEISDSNTTCLDGWAIKNVNDIFFVSDILDQFDIHPQRSESAGASHYFRKMIHEDLKSNMRRFLSERYFEAYRHYDDPARKTLNDLLDAGLIEDLRRSRYEFKDECTLTDGTGKDGVSEYNQRGGKICISVGWIKKKKKFCSSDKVMLHAMVIHELAHHFGYADENHDLFNFIYQSILLTQPEHGLNYRYSNYLKGITVTRAYIKNYREFVDSRTTLEDFKFLEGKKLSCHFQFEPYDVNSLDPYNRDRQLYSTVYTKITEAFSQETQVSPLKGLQGTLLNFQLGARSSVMHYDEIKHIATPSSRSPLITDLKNELPNYFPVEFGFRAHAGKLLVEILVPRESFIINSFPSVTAENEMDTIGYAVCE